MYIMHNCNITANLAWVFGNYFFVAFPNIKIFFFNKLEYIVLSKAKINLKICPNGYFDTLCPNGYFDTLFQISYIIFTIQFNLLLNMAEK